MRAAYRRTRRAFLGSVRPLVILSAGVLLAWALSSAGWTGESFRKLWQGGVSGEAAGAALSFEWGVSSGESLGWTTLLRLSSPVLSFLTPAKPMEEQSSVPDSTEPPSPKNETPVLVPMLPLPAETLQDITETEATPEAGESFAATEGDDRVWPVPSADTPDAHAVKEVTLLPSYGGQAPSEAAVAVNNDTKYTLDIPALLEAASVLKPTTNGAPQVLILHTHGSESFLPDARSYYIPTDIERTEDTRYNVVRLGDEMTRRLEEQGIGVLHDRDIHDYPSYNHSYSRAYNCIVQYLEDYPSIQMVIDIHRDSISTSDGTMYKAVSQTEKGKAAQMMFVIGSNGSGLVHDNWRGNLSLAAQMQQQLLSTYPTLMRPIHLRTERFNQHATPGSMILEVGTAANALEEALLSIELFCDVLGPWLAERLTAS